MALLYIGVLNIDSLEKVIHEPEEVLRLIGALKFLEDQRTKAHEALKIETAEAREAILKTLTPIKKDGTKCRWHGHWNATHFYLTVDGIKFVCRKCADSVARGNVSVNTPTNAVLKDLSRQIVDTTAKLGKALGK